MPKLTCIFCGGRAELRGRWANARVACRDCGLESGPEEYRDQIERWQETACAIAFGTEPSESDGVPDPADDAGADRPGCAGNKTDP